MNHIEEAACLHTTDEADFRKSVERYHSLAEKLPLMFWTAGPSGEITFVNARLREFCGPDAEGDASGWSKLVIHPDDITRCTPLWQAALHQGKAYEVELRIRRTDGSYRWCITRAAPQQDAAGRIFGWFGVTIDIHELKLAALGNSPLPAPPL